MAKNVTLINKINSSFEIKCLTVLVKSYNTSITEKRFSKDWEEKTFSSHLVSLMKKCDLAIKYNFTITKEEELEDEDIDKGLKSPKEANPIDIRFHDIWKNELRLDFNVEAKNISLSEWRKSNGKKVNASQQQTEYITKGIDRFLTGHYKDKNGCMLGYLVNGNLDEVLVKINDKILKQKNASEYINSGFVLNKHQIFESIHNERKLNHLFFQYSN
ncbi:hypothetical protein [Flavobacterium sp.]|uniref:hypothetical protein n=1 Tax=Flavobacterium sp. TaxID=239 RepID=UPI0040485D3E